jgi:uncharacterized protein (TIGR02265 family)
VCTRVLRGEHTPIRTLAPEISGELAALVEAMIALDPALRPRSAREVLERTASLAPPVHADRELATLVTTAKRARDAEDARAVCARSSRKITVPGPGQMMNRNAAVTYTAPASKFVKPDWTAPLDLQKRIASMPANATVRGLFFNDLFAQFPDVHAHAQRDRYLTFSNYPFSEWCQVLTTAARVCFPKQTPREGVRRIGRRAFPALAQSHAGRVLFALAGNDALATIKVSSKAFALAQSHGSCEVVSVERGVALLHIRDAWDYPDAYYVGVYEGVFEVFGLAGEIDVCVRSLCDCDLRLTWNAVRG